jgi:hypothetical protein
MDIRPAPRQYLDEVLAVSRRNDYWRSNFDALVHDRNGLAEKSAARRNSDNLGRENCELSHVEGLDYQAGFVDRDNEPTVREREPTYSRTHTGRLADSGSTDLSDAAGPNLVTKVASAAHQQGESARKQNECHREKAYGKADQDASSVDPTPHPYPFRHFPASAMAGNEIVTVPDVAIQPVAADGLCLEVKPHEIREYKSQGEPRQR